MDIAAEKVQREVQAVTDDEDRYEEPEAVGDSADGVEHRRDDGAGEHQSHDTGIGQDIAEPAGGGIVKSPEQAAELAEDALGAA